MGSMSSSRMGIQWVDRKPDSGNPVQHSPGWHIRGHYSSRCSSGRSFDRNSGCNSGSYYSDCRNLGFLDWRMPGYFADHIPDLVHAHTMRESGINLQPRKLLKVSWWTPYLESLRCSFPSSATLPLAIRASSVPKRSLEHDCFQ
jgi:hypothetical protein